MIKHHQASEAVDAARVSDLQLRETRERLNFYIRKVAPKVSGWLSRESAEVIGHLALRQLQDGLGGGVGEIGIHHGKLFLLLYLSLQPDERAFALDVFEDQDLNVDGSGRGDRAVFLQNFAKVGGKEEQLTILAVDSTAVSAEELRTAAGPLRMMSVDGGHTEDITYNDLQLAEEVLLDDGILILDDVYQQRWPAVAAGAFRFVLENGHQLRPFAISPNKTYFCKNPQAASRYYESLASAFPELRLNEVTMFGSRVLVLGERSLVNRIRNLHLVRNNPGLYRRLSRIRARFS